MRGGGGRGTVSNTSTPPTRFCIKIGSAESHFNVAVTVRGKVARLSVPKPQFITF